MTDKSNQRWYNNMDDRFLVKVHGRERELERRKENATAFCSLNAAEAVMVVAEEHWLQKVLGRRPLRWNAMCLLCCCIERFVLLIQVIIQLENRCHVSATIAVIRCRPNRYDCLIEHQLIPFQNQLMCSRDQVEIVRVGKALNYVTSEEEACTSGAHSPAGNVVRVGPEEVAHGSIVGTSCFLSILRIWSKV